MLRTTFCLLVPLHVLTCQLPQAAAEPTVVLTGCVVDLRGEPVPLAKMRVTDPREPERTLAQTLGDGSALFRCAHVPDRAGWVVRASAPGFCCREMECRSRTVRIALHESATLRGVLEGDSGTPVSGAMVWAQPVTSALSGVRVEAMTDAEGRFLLAGVPLGPSQLAAVGPKGGLAELTTLVAGDGDLALHCGPAKTTSLTIDVHGVQGATAEIRISIRPMSATGYYLPMPVSWGPPRLDPDGRLAWQGVPAVEYEVTPASDRFAFQPQSTRSERQPCSLTFVATKLGSAELRCPAQVRDPSGQPVAGLRIAMVSATSGNSCEARSGDDGSLTFDSPEMTGTMVRVRSLDDRFVLEEDECRVFPAGTITRHAVRACTVRGRVLLPGGGPARYVDVDLAPVDASHSPITSSTTDQEGNYCFACVRPREHELCAMVRGQQAADSQCFALASPGMQVTVPDLKLAPTSIVEGVVVDARGHPLPGQPVCLYSIGPGTVEEASRRDQVCEVVTDRKGRYRFVGVLTGEIHVRLSLPTQDVPGDPGPPDAVEPFMLDAGKTCTFELRLPRSQ